MLRCATRSVTDSRKEEKSQAAREAEARNIRAAAVLTPPPRAFFVGRTLSWHEDVEAPPAYSTTVQYASPPAMSYDEKNEKQALAVAYGIEPPPNSPGLSDEGNNSDASSVISTPSTQITGLGSMYTGRTVRRSRLSDEYASRPPSYSSYARSVDRRSSVSSTSTGQVLRHPVMHDDWFQNLSIDSRSMYGD